MVTSLYSSKAYTLDAHADSHDRMSTANLPHAELGPRVPVRDSELFFG